MSRLYPIFTVDQAKSFEQGILGNDSSKTAAAMQQAGRAIGRAIFEDYCEIRPWPDSPHILVLAGKGLNGGDAVVACQALHEALPGLRVTIVATALGDELNPIAMEALDALQEVMGESLMVLPVEDYLDATSPAVDVVIDGLYGMGFRPPLREMPARLLDSVNSRSDIAMRASVDIPSGIGEEADRNCFKADFTYIPGVAKKPCFEEKNARAVGRIRLLEIDPFLDQPADSTDFQVASPEWYKTIHSLRSSGSDKRTFGHCLVLAGSPQMPGAAIMSTLGCVQSGAGLVTTLCSASICSHIAASVPEAMWTPLPLTHDGGIDVEAVRIVSRLAQKANSLLIGPGMVMDRSTVFSICRIIRETSMALVLDASALTQDVVSSVLGRSLSSGPVVITPHRGEFARLLGMKEDADSVETLKSFSRKHRLITVLKGSPTLVCDGYKVISVPSGGPVLARGGSGDILSGILLTQLAQSPEAPLEAVLRAVTWHGAAADRLAREKGAVAVRTTELLPHLSASLRS